MTAMGYRTCAVIGFSFLLVMTFSIGIKVPQASADGGPVLSDPEVWVLLSEGQQIAVVRLDEGDAAHVDLFITLLDRGEVSHRITFFVPLGVQASAFELTEQTQLEYDAAHTADLDQELSQAI